jgi:hypothetical protein
MAHPDPENVDADAAVALLTTTGEDPPLEELPILGPEHEVHDSDELEPGSEPIVDTPDEELAGDYRKIYATQYAHLDRNLRVASIRHAEGVALLALCLDPEPAVIAAVFDSGRVGLDHARLAALHHRNPAGLEHVVKRADFARDARVQRNLLKNSQLTEPLLRRLLLSKPLREIYKVALDRELPERTRQGSRALLRTRFASAEAEERASFIVSNEARALALLIGQTFDQKTTAILCARQYNSVMFIQNLAHFSACPPALLAHLFKQPFVRRNAPLKKLLLQHPNLPSQLKREG